VLVDGPAGAMVDPQTGLVTWTPARDAGTSAVFELRAYDGGGGYARQRWTVAVTGGNHAPVLLPIADQSLREGDLLLVPVSAYDADGDPLVYWADQLPPGAMFDARTNTLRWQTRGDDAGRYADVTVYASDGLHRSSTTFQIAVVNTNQPLQLAPLVQRTIREGDTLRLRLTASDADGDAVTFASPNLPIGAQLDPLTGQFVWTPRYDQHGDYQIEFTANDGNGSSQQTLNVEVLNVNGAVRIEPLDRLEIHEGQALSVRIVALDPDHPALPIRVPVTAEELDALTAGRAPSVTVTHTALPPGAAFDPQTHVLSWTPGFQQAGTYAITFTATDDGDGTGTATTAAMTTQIEVRDVNAPPAVTPIANQAVDAGQTLDLLVTAADTDDPSGQTLSWSASGLPAYATLVDHHDGTAAIQFAPTRKDRGNEVITVTATDDGNGDPARALSASDPDGDPLLYRAGTLPRGAAFDPRQGVLTFQPDYSQTGSYTVRLEVTDGNRTDSEDVAITVQNVNQPPVFAPLPGQLGQEGTPLAFTIAAGDLDQDTLVYAAETTLPPGASFDPATHLFRWTPSHDQAGLHTFSFSAADPGGLTAILDVQVQVLNVNRPPVLPALGGHNLKVGQPFELVIPGSDPDAGCVLTYSVDGLPANAMLDVATGRLTWTPNATQIGEHELLVTVSDGQLQAWQPLTLVAAYEPALPDVLIELTPSFPVPVGQPVLVHVAASGLAAIQSLELQVHGTPLALDAFQRASFVPTQPGHVVVTATATDIAGYVGTATRDLKVRDLNDQAAPAVTLAAPAPGAILQTPTAIVATVTDGNLDEYTLDIARLGSEQFVALAHGTAPVADSALAELDPGRWANDAYLLRLVATDMAGRRTETTRIVELNTAAKPGSYATSVTDLAATLDGAPISLTRLYSTLQASTSGPFGFGWQWAGASPQVTTNLPPTGAESSGVWPAMQTGTRLYINLPDGRRAVFTFTPTTVEQGGFRYYLPAWTPEAGGDYRLQTAAAALQEVNGAFYELAGGLPYNPASGQQAGFAYTLIAADGQRYRYNADQRLREIVAPSGTTLVVTDSGIVAASGERISFTCDRAGRLVAVTPPDGNQVRYSYDVAGQLATVGNGAGQRTWYDYATLGAGLATSPNDPTAGLPMLLSSVVTSDGVGSRSIRYSAEGQWLDETPIDRVLGVPRQFLGQAADGSVSAGGVERFAIVIGTRELATSVTGRITLGLEVRAGGDFQQAAAVIPGLPVGESMVRLQRSLALYALDRPGVYVIEVAGAGPATSGEFTLEAYLAGDVDLDADVDGADAAALDQALGTTAGQPAYVAAADANRDGAIDATDRLYLDGSFAFVANQAPAAVGRAETALPGLPVSVDLAALAHDPEGDALAFVVTAVRHGAVTLVDGGRTAIFTPEAGYTGPAGFDFLADDGSLASATATVSVDVIDATLRSIRLSQQDLVLDAGGSAELTLLGEFSTGWETVLPASHATYASSNPDVAIITEAGTVSAVGTGSAVIVVTCDGLTAATPIKVGQDGPFPRVEFFPETYAVTLGETRQFQVRELQPDQSVVDRSAAADGTVYFVGNPAVGTITADGLFTPTGLGQTYVTVIPASLPGRSARRRAGPAGLRSAVCRKASRPSRRPPPWSSIRRTTGTIASRGCTTEPPRRPAARSRRAASTTRPSLPSTRATSTRPASTS